MVDLNKDLHPGHEPTSLSEDVVDELVAAFGVDSPYFTQPVATAPMCCKYHLLKWIAERLRAGHPIANGDRERVAEGLEVILEEMRLLGKDGAHANAVVTAAIDGEKTISQVLDDAVGDHDGEGDDDAIVISVPLPEGVTPDAIGLQQVLFGLLGKRDEPVGDVLLGLTGESPQEEASLTAGVHCQPDGVRIVTEQGTVLLPVSTAVEFAGTIAGWISGQEELMRLLEQHAAHARNRQARESQHNQDGAG